MTLRNRACILSGDTEFHLPPFGDGTPVASVTPLMVQVGKPVPYAGYDEAYNKRHGWEITASGLYITTTAELGEAWKDNLIDTLVDEDGYARAIEFAEWADSAQSLQRIFWLCTLQGKCEFSGSTSRRVGYSFNLLSKDPARHEAWSSGGTPGAGPYEAYIYQGQGSVTPAVPTNLTVPIPVFFSGLIAVTTANNVGSMQFALKVPTGCRYIKSIYIPAATLGDESGSGADLIDVGTGPYSAPGSTLRATLNYNETFTALTSGSIAVTAGNTVYVFIAAGSTCGHSNVTAIVTFGS